MQRRVSVEVDADLSPFNRSVMGGVATWKGFVHELESSESRFTSIVQSALALAPAIVPIGAAGVPVIAGLATQLGAAAAAGGVAILAFQGVGDALKALNEYQLDPTEEHLQAMQEKMDALGPAGERFVRTLQDFRPELQDLQDVAQAGLFPGLTQSLTELEQLKPQAASLIDTIARSMGDLAAEGAGNLNDQRWVEFFEFLDREAEPTLKAMGTTLGYVVEGLANMMMAFDPLADDFTQGMVGYAKAFRGWSDGLDQSQGFQEFVDYIEQNGPEALETLAALGDALVSLVTAAAPVGSALLPVIEALAKTLSAIADSPVGPVLIGAAAAVGTLGRSLALLQAVGLRSGDSMLARVFQADKLSAGALALTQVTSAQDRARLSTTQLMAAEQRRQATVRAGLGQLGRSAALVGGLALATSGYADKTGLANTASYALMGTIAGPWGAAVGAGVGLTMDFAAANNNLESAISGANRALESMDVNALKSALTVLDEQIAATEDKLNVSLGFNPFKNFNEYMSGTVAGVNDLLTGSGDQATQKRAELEKALEESAAKAARATITQDQYTGAVGRSGIAAGLTASEVNGLVSAMEDNTNAALAAFDAVTQYRQALKDAREQAAKTEAGIRGNSDEALANREALSQLAGAWNNQSDAVRNNTARFRAAKDAFIETAAAMGVPIDKAKQLARNMLEIPDKRVIQITMTGADEANADLQRIRSQMALIHDKDVRLTYYVTQVNAGNVQAAGGRDGDPSTPQAGGGFVPKTGLPYADRHPYLLADGEGITTNRHGETDRFRDIITAINAGASRPQVRGMLADGGVAGTRPWSRPAATSDRYRTHYVPAARYASSTPAAAAAMPSELRLVGTLKSNFGPVDVEGTARVVAREEIAADARFQQRVLRGER